MYAIISLFASIIIPPLGLPIALCGYRNDMAHWKVYSFILALFVSIMSYCFYPTTEEMDLIRYYDYVSEIANCSSLKAALKYGGYGAEGLWFFSGLCWIIGKIGDLQLLPAISVFCVYFVGFYITCYIGTELNINKKYILAYILFILLSLQYFYITSSIRSEMAFALVTLAVFRDCFMGKRNIFTFLLYAIPLFIHFFAVILILLRILLLLPEKIKKITLVFLLFLKPLLKIFWLCMPYNNAHSAIIKYFAVVISKAYGYFYGLSATEFAQRVKNSGTMNIQKVAYILIALLFVFMSSYVLQKLKSLLPKNNGLTQFITFTLYITIIVLAFAVTVNSPEYWRFGTIIYIAGGCIYLPAVEFTAHTQGRQLVYYMLFLAAIMCSSVWIRQVLIDCDMFKLLVYPFISSPIFIFLKALLG